MESTRLCTKYTWPPRANSISMPGLIRSGPNGATTVWIASRSFGGVSITDISRRPSSDMCSVRGIGVADIATASTALADLLQPFLVLHAEALLLIDQHQPEIFPHNVLREEPVRPDGDIDLAFRQIHQHRVDLLR